MIRHLGLHRTDQAEVIGQRADLRKQITDFEPALAILLKLERRRKGRPGLALGLDVFARQRLARVFLQRRLGIERVHVRWPAVEEEMHHAFGLAGKMRRFGRKRIDAFRRPRGGREQAGFAKQGGETERAHPHAALAQEVAARDKRIAQIGFMVRHAATPGGKMFPYSRLQSTNKNSFDNNSA